MFRIVASLIVLAVIAVAALLSASGESVIGDSGSVPQPALQVPAGNPAPAATPASGGSKSFNFN